MSAEHLPTLAAGADPLGEGRAAVEQALPGYMAERRWFRSKARQIVSAQIHETVAMPYGDTQAQLAFVQVEYTQGPGETYVLPLLVSAGAPAERIAGETPHALIGRVAEPDGVLHDATVDRDFTRALLQLIADDARLAGAGGELAGTTTQAFQELRGAGEAPEPSIMKAEQSNTSIVYGDRLIMKIFRRAEEGVNPDLEIGRFLTERRAFGNIPPIAGAIEYLGKRGEPTTLAILMGFVRNRGDAWAYTLEALEQFFARAAAAGANPPDESPLSTGTLLRLADQEIPAQARELIGDYLDSARLLGRRTAELHLALAGNTDDPAFAPEPFGEHERRELYDSLRAQSESGLQMLREKIDTLPEAARADAQQILDRAPDALERFKALVDQPLDALRTRIHGDYHLGQVLYTGEDFYIIDFEGEPARPLSERRAKRSPLQDVAGMLRSFHYASYAALREQGAQAEALEPWARFWHRWVSVAFTNAYLATAGDAAFLPRSRDQLRVLLGAHLMEKAIYELAYELNNRPSWTPIPIEGILQLLETGD